MEEDRFTVAAALKLTGASGVRVRMHTAADGLPAVTEFEVLARRQTPNGEPLALLAWKLTLPHPGTGAPMSFEAPLAADLQAFWDGLVSPATARGNRPPT